MVDDAVWQALEEPCTLQNAGGASGGDCWRESSAPVQDGSPMGVKAVATTTRTSSFSRSFGRVMEAWIALVQFREGHDSSEFDQEWMEELRGEYEADSDDEHMRGLS